MLNLQGRSLQSAIAVSAGSAYLLFGYDQGVLGGLVSYPGFLAAIDNPSSGYLGTIVALFNIGCLMGCVISAFFGNRLGRKNAITLGCVIMVLGGAVQASTYSAGQLIAGRIISGIGNGINTSTVPVYVSETSRTAVRGRSLAIQMSIVIFGTVVAYWLDYGMIRTQIGEVVWRFPLAFQNFFALITIITMPLLPESPRWLYSHGRQREAISVLSRLLSLSEDHPDVCTVVAEMEQALSVEQNNKQKLSISSLLFQKTEMKNARRLTLCFVIQFFQQFTGINVIAFYVTIVLETNVGLSRELSSLVAGFIQIAFWVGTFPPIFLIDRLGRRKVLMLGSTILCLALVLFTVGIALKTPASSRLALGMLIIYEISFGMSWNAVPWLYAPEITPLNIRHVGAAVGCFSEWLWTFVIAQMTPPAIANTGWKIYLLFCFMTALSIPFVYFFMPETSGKTLEEIDYIFVKHRGHSNEMIDTPQPSSNGVPEKSEGELAQIERV
ncbi:Sugar/inositol transporter [Penicillium camemberti]|uniref:Sugar/inositol transporter n=1 Tax=Penicillium camemberti (strain FM 013) TaxID=1429867 RepID=A0A0G4PU68_PENC3|nr:Sugar/inositol transporter [Penicillium camemberti]